MPHLGQQIAMRRTVAPQAIDDEPPRLVLEARQQALEEAFGGRGIPPILDQDVEYVAVLINGAPEILQIPLIFRNTSSRCQTSPGLGRHLRSLAAKSAPKRRHQRWPTPRLS
nr:hypothetical protein [Pseudoroseomonas wenyumeiae]